MTREQYERRRMELLREYASVHDPHAPHGHRTVAEFHVASDITAFVQTYWRPEFSPIFERHDGS